MPKHPIKNLGAFAHPAKSKKPKAAIPGDISAPSIKPKKSGKMPSFPRPNHENNFKRVTKSPFEGQ